MSDEQVRATVKLGGEDVTLERPDDVMLRMEIWELGGASMGRARAAALGICWRGLSRPEASLRQCRYDLGLYAGQVLAELVKRGIPKLQILKAGAVAYGLVVRDLLTADDIEAAKGNSEGEGDSAG